VRRCYQPWHMLSQLPYSPTLDLPA
jgi:hypothetical protein